MTARKPRAATTPPTDDDPRDRGVTPSSLSVRTAGDADKGSFRDGVGEPPVMGDAGRALWAAVAGRFDLAAHELSLLRLACDAADACAEVAATLAAEGRTVADPNGVSKPHPLLIEQRFQQMNYAKLMAALRVPDDDGFQAARHVGIRGAHTPSDLL